MKPIARINELIDAHEDYLKCKGCKGCKEIERLRSGIDKDPVRKYADILSKGQDMTLSEIKLLIGKGVQKRDISKALNMDKNDFTRILEKLDLKAYYKKKKTEEVEEMALTKEKLEKHLAAGLSTKEIAKKENVSTATVYSAKSQYGLSKKRGEEKPAEKLEAVKQEVKQAIAEDPSKIQDLENLIAKLEGELSERKINEVFSNNSIAVLQTENKELKQQLDKLKEENTNLKASAEDTESEAYRAALSIKELTTQNAELTEEVEMLRENVKVAEEDRDLASWEYKEVNKVYIELVHKNSLATKLLKEVL